MAGRQERGGRGGPAKRHDHGRGRGAPSGRSRGPQRRQERTPAARTAEQQRYDGPDLPDDVSADDLDKHVRRQLSGLPERLAERVARHLVMAGRLLDENPDTAYAHAQAARARAARVAVVREACGEVAYAAGKWSEALAELRAAKRMNGAVDYLPMMADCERALGRPDRALSLAKDGAVAKLDQAGQVEMTIVESGARRDMGQPEMAVALLEAAPVTSRSRAPWVVRLRYAYADALLDVGRRKDAIEWFHRTVAVDGEGMTDAVERLAGLGESSDD